MLAHSCIWRGWVSIDTIYTPRSSIVASFGFCVGASRSLPFLSSCFCSVANSALTALTFPSRPVSKMTETSSMLRRLGAVSESWLVGGE